VQFNPNFGGGRIALAKVFLDRDNPAGALEELEKAVELSPDNILAHMMLADCYLKAQRPKDALRSFKMVLFLAPTNEKAMKAVRKLESLTADEYEDDLFEMKPLPQMDELRTESPARLKPVSEKQTSDLERILSLVDAFIVRNDIEKASATLKESERSFGSHPELVKRLKLVNQRGFQAEEAPPPEELPNRRKEALENKIEYLRHLLARVQRYS
jgi:tetratricopeptide (TPR) repeat protein